MHLVRRTVVATASLALAATLAACTGGEESTKGADKSGQNASQGTETRSAVQAMTAATRKTSEAKSARVSMTMTVPGEGGTVEVNGVMAWDPYAMDVTMTGSQLAATPDAPEKMRMVWLDEAMYMDMGEKAAAERDGKRWLKLDLQAIAESAEDPALAKSMTSGMENMGQSPAQQMGLLLDSPNMKSLGEEKLDGVSTRHYKGSLTIEEMLDANKSLDVLDAKQREQLVEQLKTSGIKGYDIEAWINEDDLPVRIDVAMESPQGTIEMSQTMRDFGADLDLQAPPADETVDLMKMLEELQQGAGGTSAGAGTGI